MNFTNEQVQAIREGDPFPSYLRRLGRSAS